MLRMVAPSPWSKSLRLAAGEVKEVTLRLPQKALKLPAPNGKTFAFSHLFVAVDLMNTVAETDETNNTAVVERTALETLALPNSRLPSKPRSSAVFASPVADERRDFFRTIIKVLSSERVGFYSA